MPLSEVLVMLDLEFVVRSVNQLAKVGFDDQHSVYLAETVAREIRNKLQTVTTADVIAAAHAVAIGG